MKPLLLLFALMAAAAGCASPAEFRVGSEVVVELDAFSGRRNPTWSLTDAERAELARRLSGLPEASAQALPDLGLGYRGFRIVTTREADGAPRQVYVTSGLVRIGEPGERPIYRDVHGLERWLQAQARREGYGGVLPNQYRSLTAPFIRIRMQPPLRIALTSRDRR